MGTVARFEELEVWQSARELARRVYCGSGAGEFARDFGLRDPIRRAAVSVMSNVAEGFERDTDCEFRHFLSVAKRISRRSACPVVRGAGCWIHGPRRVRAATCPC